MNFNEIAEPIGRNSQLNPVLWDMTQLNPQVRSALLRIAKDFKDFIGIPFRVVDVIVAGGSANYTYTKHSDIDLHLIADYDSVDCDREAAELFDSKRHLYKRDHNINIRGIPVELYVEDSREPSVSAAYSILHNKWIREPDPHIPEIDTQDLEEKTKMWTRIIKQATKTGDLNTMRTVLHLLKKYRQMGLRTAPGEYSIPNLVYKSLRNDQTLKGLYTLVDRLHDQQLSLPE